MMVEQHALFFVLMDGANEERVYVRAWRDDGTLAALRFRYSTGDFGNKRLQKIMHSLCTRTSSSQHDRKVERQLLRAPALTWAEICVES